MSRRVIRGLFVESLELRQLLCATHATLQAYPTMASLSLGDDGHVSAADFLKKNPSFVGKNLWTPSVFNPTNSTDSKKWLFDPHIIAADKKTDSFYVDKLPAGGKLAEAIKAAKQKAKKKKAKKPAAPVTTMATFASGAAISAAASAPITAQAITTVLPDFQPALSGTPNIDLTTQAGRTLFRFGTQVNNLGLGPATLVGGATYSDGTQDVYQRIYSWDSATNKLTAQTDRLAGRFVWHPTHSHLHFEGYASYRLLTKVNGAPGPVATRSDGTPAVGEKVGFCLINIMNSFTLPSGQSSTTLATYNASGQPSTGCGQLQGVNPGRADVYSSSLDQQWIDITGVPDGSYYVEITLDAKNAVSESNESNNVGIFPVTVTGSPSAPDRFETNNTRATAKALGEQGVSSTTGLTIHANSDHDWFSFVATSSGSGTVSAVSAGGTIALTLFNASGTQLATNSNPTAGTPTAPTTASVSYNFVAGTTYYTRTTSYNSASQNRAYELRFNISPAIRISSAATTLAENSATNAKLTVARNGPSVAGLTFNFALSGTATRGVDYNVFANGSLVSGNSLAIGADGNTLDIEIAPLTDAHTEGTETVVFALTSASGYVLGTPASATISLTDSTTGLPPAAPGTLTTGVVAGPGVRLNWQDLSTNETGFKIERRYTGWTWGEIATVGPNVSSYIDTGVWANVAYEYRVRATNAVGDSGYSPTSTINVVLNPGPNAPTGLTASATSQTSVTLNWIDGSTDEVDFEIQRSTDATFGTFTSIVAAANAQTFVDTGLTANTLYFYRVRARNAAGSSAFTATANATTPGGAGLPAAPGNLVASLVSGQAKLTWSDLSTNETGFRIERRYTNWVWGTVATVGANTTSFIDTTAWPGAAYEYRIVAINSNGDGGTSNGATITV